jgi:hypothetical protein
MGLANHAHGAKGRGANGRPIAKPWPPQTYLTPVRLGVYKVHDARHHVIMTTDMTPADGTDDGIMTTRPGLGLTPGVGDDDDPSDRPPRH